MSYWKKIARIIGGLDMEYVPSKPKRKRGRPRKFQGDEVISLGGKPEENMSQEDVVLMKKEIAELKTQLASLIDVGEKKEEIKNVPIDMKKIETGNIMNINERERVEAKIERLRSQLENKETPIDRGYGKDGGMAECFVKNDCIDKRVIHDRLMHAHYTLQVGTHGNLSDNDKNKLYHIKTEIEKELRDTLPSLSKQNSEDEKVLNETAIYIAQHNTKYNHLRVKLKNINKILDSENPNAGSLMYLLAK